MVKPKGHDGAACASCPIDSPPARPGAVAGMVGDRHDNGRDWPSRRGASSRWPRLLELCAALEIEPQAVRTAMSRLSKEGLVTGRRWGGRHFIASQTSGLEQYHRAACQIYAAPRDIEHWCYGLIGTDVDLAQLQKDCAAEPPLILGARLACWPAAAMPEGLKPWRDRLVIFDSPPFTFPDWARRQVFPALNAESCGLIVAPLRALLMGMC